MFKRNRINWRPGDQVQVRRGVEVEGRDLSGQVGTVTATAEVESTTDLMVVTHQSNTVYPLSEKQVLFVSHKAVA